MEVRNQGLDRDLCHPANLVKGVDGKSKEGQQFPILYVCWWFQIGQF